MVKIEWLQFGPTICQGNNSSEWWSRNVHLLYTCITDYAQTKGFNLYTSGHDKSPKPFNALAGSGKDWMITIRPNNLPGAGANSSEWRSRKVHLLYICITDYAQAKGFNLYTLGHDRSPKPFTALFCHCYDYSRESIDSQTDRRYQVHYLPVSLSYVVHKHGEQRDGTWLWHSVYREDTLLKIPILWFMQSCSC